MPSPETDSVVEDVQRLDGIISLRVQRGISVHPPGDVITVETLNGSLSSLLRLLEQRGVGRSNGRSLTTSDPLSVVSPPFAEAIARDANEATWEEMELTIAKESNMTIDALLVMAISGIFAAIGLATNALHLVVGAMVIAPGFEPLSRISLGIVARGVSWKRGLIDVAKGYLALLGGAVATGIVLRLLGTFPANSSPSYLPPNVLVSYWISITPASVIVAAAAGIGGALLIASHRSILTAGVMIALALIPTIGIAGLALVVWRLDVIGQVLLRWLVEASLVVIGGLVVFGTKQLTSHRRVLLS